MNRLIPEIRRLSSPTVMVGVCLFFILIPSLQNYLSVKVKPAVNITLIEIIEEEVKEEVHKACGDTDLFLAWVTPLPDEYAVKLLPSGYPEEIPDILLSHTTPPPEFL